MPSSRPQTIGPILDLVMRKQPASVLDVGSGFGKYGLLLREYLEVWQGRLEPATWQTRIDALEVFTPYTRLPWYPTVYDTVHRSDVRECADLLPLYALVLWGDVIEHLPKDEGRALLGCCADYIVSTPNYDSKQGASFGNEAERHVSRWSRRDFPHSKVVERKWIIGWKL